MPLMKMFAGRSKQPYRRRRLTHDLGQETETQWFGHISRSSGLARTILHGRVKGKKRLIAEEVGRQYEGVDADGLC